MKPRDLGPLLRPTPPWLFSLSCTPSELTDLGWALQRLEFGDGVVRRIRGLKMRTFASLCDEIAASLQFPYYFGENWDALDECLNDLDWLPGCSYLLLISDALAVLSEEPPEQFATFVRILMRSSEQWAAGRMEGEPWDSPPAPFHIVLQCLEGDEIELTRRVRAGGGEIEPLPATR